MIDILLNHPDFFIINKPVGIGVHSEKNSDAEAQQGLLIRLKEQTNWSQLYPVHRLDKVTSGVMLIAKNADSASELSQLFQNREIEKYYLVISDKKPKKKQGMVKGEMQPARRSQWKLIPEKNSDKNNNYTVTQFFSMGLENGSRLYLVKPLTGKTHQIRVMMKSLGATIVGDKLYSGSHSDRCYLHAYALKFSYQHKQYYVLCPPSSGEHYLSSSITSIVSNEWAHPGSLKWPTYR